MKTFPVLADYCIGDPRKDANVSRLVESLAECCQDSILRTLVGAGVVKGGQSIKELLEVSSAFMKDMALIPSVNYDADLIDPTVVHVRLSVQAVKIEPKAEVCEQCGGSKVDIGLDDMGTPVEGPCRKCQA